MNAVTEMPDPIIFTDSAAAKVAQLIEEEMQIAMRKHALDCAMRATSLKPKRF